MKPETNLLLRALIGKEKQHLIMEKTRIVSDYYATSPASRNLPTEDVEKIILIDHDIKSLNSALSELKEESKKNGQIGTNHSQIVVDECPAPTLSPETVQTIREALDIHVKSAECCYPVIESMADTSIFFGPKENSKILQRAKDGLDNARRAKEEFNALYPIPEEKK